MSDAILKSIDDKLRIMTKLLALDVVKGRTFQEQVKLLHDLGMQPIEIANCLGKTSNNVRVAIHSVNKKRDEKI